MNVIAVPPLVVAVVLVVGGVALVRRTSRTPRERVQVVAAVLAALLLIGLPSGAAAAPDGRDTVPFGDLVVDGAHFPVRGTFVYHRHHDDSNEEIRGLVHGVRRIDGGTVLYFSIGSAHPDGFRGTSMTDLGEPPYALNSAWDLRLVDTGNLMAYQPLATDDWTFTTMKPDLSSESGQLRVGVAIFPELPQDVEAVQVIMPWGTPAGEVVVEDGALEPFTDETAPRLGTGWPRVASAQRLAEVDPSRFVFDLRRVSADLEGRATVEETASQVDVALDANVLFEFDSAALSAEAQGTLAQVAADIAARGSGEVQVVGHTDAEGSDVYNQTLSEQRAQAVVGALAPQAGANVSFVPVGRGEAEPVADNSTPEGRAANRRVTVTYTVGASS